MRLFRFSLPLLLLAAVSACSSVGVEDYASNSPRLVAEQFFNGQLSAHGVVKNRAGKVIRFFNADISAYWRDGVGTLDEQFVFDDGEQQRRVWTLKPLGDGRYRASAGDVVGEAEAQIAGNSMFLDYVLRIPYQDSSLAIHIDDRMYLVNERVLINESRMSKFGVDVGELLLVITRL